MKLQHIDYSLYLVTDRGLARGRATLDIVKAAVQGGVTCVQLREKDCSTLEFIEQALAIKNFLRAGGVPLIINDRVDVALAVEAEGVHLGQTDMPLDMAKKIVGDSMIIGISAESIEDAAHDRSIIDDAAPIGASSMMSSADTMRSGLPTSCASQGCAAPGRRRCETE